MPLSQNEADDLIFNLDKIFIGPGTIGSPSFGDSVKIPLTSPQAPQERFILDINRKYKSAQLSMNRVTFQKRVRNEVQLVRIDFGDRQRHMNPDDNWLDEPHVHVFIEGSGLDWAYPLDPQNCVNFMAAHPYLPRFNFPAWDLLDHRVTWDTFLNWTRVSQPPVVDWRLF